MLSACIQDGVDCQAGVGAGNPVLIAGGGHYMLQPDTRSPEAIVPIDHGRMDVAISLYGRSTNRDINASDTLGRRVVGHLWHARGPAVTSEGMGTSHNAAARPGENGQANLWSDPWNDESAIFTGKMTCIAGVSSGHWEKCHKSQTLPKPRACKNRGREWHLADGGSIKMVALLALGSIEPASSAGNNDRQMDLTQFACCLCRPFSTELKDGSTSPVYYNTPTRYHF
ncbi:hypothetical protein Bbelb_179150 [Branchiostoma belcheri]|nr:hypothetical protein Bbelb_179150 [Branchiostoma belcheri]